MIITYSHKDLEIQFERDTGMILKAFRRVDGTQIWDDVTSLWFNRVAKISARPEHLRTDDELYFIAVVDGAYEDALAEHKWEQIESETNRAEDRCKEDIEDKS